MGNEANINKQSALDGKNKHSEVGDGKVFPLF
jgi:hypothetical protein